MADIRHIGRVAALAVALGTTAAAAAVAAPTIAPADADPALWAVIVYSPATGFHGGSSDAPTEQSAVDKATGSCTSKGGTDCQRVAWATNGCASLYDMPGADDRFSGGAGPTSQAASSDASSRLPGGAHALTICSTGGGAYGGGGFASRLQAQAPAPAPAELSKQGPTVSWDLIVGGLVAHIADRSGVTSQCTYTADNGFTQSFGLKANSTFDLRIVPAIPEFRNWDITVSCDNGTRTQTSTFF